MVKEINKLYKISEVSTACGISRSTIMRLEEKGLITPAYVSPESGQRYYDNHNVSQIIQIEKLKRMGLSPEQIIDYYRSGGEVEPLLEALYEKMHRIRLSIDELQLRKEPQKSAMQTITFPEITCRICEVNAPSTYEEKCNLTYAYYTECIRSGCRLTEQPLFTMTDCVDYLYGKGSYPTKYKICIPVEKGTKDAVTLPSRVGISILFLGEQSQHFTAILKLKETIKERNLTIDGEMLGIGIVAPYTGRGIDSNKFCTRYFVPIKD